MSILIFKLNKKYFSGTILEGSFVRKQNLNKTRQYSFPPVFTIGAELDGLARITRLAESFYYDYFDPTLNEIRPRLENKNNQSHTVMVPGMNHFQFVGFGKPTSTIVRNDIKPEIETNEAQNTTTSLIAAYMNYVLNKATSEDMQLLDRYQKSSLSLLSPLISSFDLEGFYELKPPCYMDPQLKPPACNQGSQWSSFSQTLMGSIDASHLSINDTFRPAAKIPEHFPSLKGNCSNAIIKNGCILNINTYTENVYSLSDQIDNGFSYIAAEEMRVKMVSRQWVLQAYTGKKFDFNKTDSENICANINKESLKWALLNAPQKTVKRYLTIGKTLVPGNDIDFKTGFTWLNTKLVI